MFVFIIFLITLTKVMAEINSNLRCVDVSMECEYRVKYCYNPNYTGLMFKMCRSTCDWCHTSLDGANRRVRRALQQQEFPEFENPIVTSAPEASGGAGGACIDHSHQCETTSSLCKNPNYQAIMNVKCPKTCGTC